MQQLSNQKPEFVLKRANDIIASAIGNADREKKMALDLLHSFIGAKRKIQQWVKAYEQLMKRHLELCIDLKNHQLAKDGLHQYRNMCQNLDPNSLEVVITHLLEIADNRATSARETADRFALAAAAKISDLDQEESPESIMLSSMTEECSIDRLNREVVVPWLKFLWETYRAVLELLHKQPKMDRLYHKTCEKAFKFCLEYQRRMEFRRLCDMLRTHLQNIQRNTGPALKANRASWEWTAEAVELHLQTRFSQLEAATSLELWNEGFRTVEDIYHIMCVGKKVPKPKLMSIYYEKLIRIFWVAGNHLFHAYAWFRYYNLVCESRKDITPEERSMLATNVLLSALSIPSTKDVDVLSAAGEDDETATERHQQIATLLDFQANPTRKSLLAEIKSRGVLEEVLPEMRSLYDDLEVTFHPLLLAKKLVPVIEVMRGNPQMAAYVDSLEKVAILRILQQLSRAYQVVRIDFVRSLVSVLPNVTPIVMERVMMDGANRKQLQLKVDQAKGCIRFGSNSPSARVENQVAQFAKELNRIRGLIALSSDSAKQAAARVRAEFFARVADSADDEHKKTLDRKNLIEQKKVELERAQEERERLEKLSMEQEQARRQAEEDARLENERKTRELEKKRIQQDKEEVRRLLKDLERLGVTKEEGEVAALTSDERAELLLKARNDLLKTRQEEGKKINEQAKRLDHLTRAVRIEEAIAVKARQDTWAAEDETRYKAKRESEMEAVIAAHKQRLAEKERFAKMISHTASFSDKIVQVQRAAYDKKVDQLRRKAVKEHRERKLASARRLYNEELERREEEMELERERKEREEREKRERELYEETRRQQQQKEAEERAREVAAEEDRKKRLVAMEEQRAKKKEEAKVAAAAAAAASAAAASAVTSARVEVESKWTRGSRLAEPAGSASTPSKEDGRRNLDEWSRSATGSGQPLRRSVTSPESGPPPRRGVTAESGEGRWGRATVQDPPLERPDRDRDGGALKRSETDAGRGRPPFGGDRLGDRDKGKDRGNKFGFGKTEESGSWRGKN